MDFDSLLNSLPTCPGMGTIPIASPTNSFQYRVAGASDFVGPLLQRRDDAVSSAAPSILVISAAGAVGKSTLAREVACRKAAPLWDLAEDSAVGAHSVIGRLTTSFGAQLPAVQAALGKGQMFLVVDALDEARLKANDAGFQAFLKDLALLPGKAGTCKAVLLGRTHVAETAWITLVDAGADVGLLTIEPFTDEQAARYVDLRVKSIGGPGATTAQAHAAKYAEARENIFTELKKAFSGPVSAATTEQARGFLGYAPVLDAVATLLAKESNYSSLIQELSQPGIISPTRSIELLSKIVDRILEREQDEKVHKNLQPGLASVASAASWSGWATMYSPNEQCGRLLGKILGANPPTPALPPSLLAAYEDRLAPFVPEHPFLRDGAHPANVVFESFLFAKALVQDVGSFRARVEARLRGEGYRPSRLLADFYQNLMGARSVGVPAAHVGLLHEALLAGESATNHLRVAIEGLETQEKGADVKSVASCEFEYVTDEGESAWAWEVEADVEPSSEIAFRNYLRDAEVTVPCGVRLGEGAKEFEIGPAVHVRCKRLVIPANSLVVGGTTRIRRAEEESAVILESDALESQICTRPTIHHVVFNVAWPGAERFPWTEFRSTESIPAGDKLHEVYRRFRRIALTFRSHSKGSLARLQDKIENQRVLQGPLGTKLLEKLKSDGVIKLDGRMYRWQPGQAGTHVGTSWHDLKLAVASERLRAYLNDFLMEYEEHP